jgi:Holliday junction DNA helicase RuvA
MIDYLHGRLVGLSPGSAILEKNGFGLKINIPVNNELSGRLQEEITLYTALVIKEDRIVLYGFSSPEERNLFDLIQSVSGFGPRLALAILGMFSVEQFYVAVMEENIKLLVTVPGIGRKGAQRLVLELKEKLPKMFTPSAGAVPADSGSLQGDIIEALCALGYAPADAADAVRRSIQEQGDGQTREELLKAALKYITGGKYQQF